MNSLPGYDARTSTIDRVLAKRAQRWGDKTFLTWLPDGSKISYAQLDDMTLRVGAGLAAAGVPAGGHVGVLMNNCPEQLLAILGPARAGFVSVPLNAAAKAAGTFAYGAQWAGQGAPLARSLAAADLVTALASEIS